MPTIAIFAGIIIRMYFLSGEHNPPHVHALYGEYAAAIAIKTRSLLDGHLPPGELGKVRRWMEAYEAELLEMWETQQFRRLPALGR
ncbi:DUF4160 domain-containing protein [Slackia equolifaciens]|uniref:DUF4160 domain-containing protein n=1 Tax=Slackia equolifaciens TaxID=498718 RepID=A0A3N0AUM4_9ACTN|nr:DUF4160 domain-containing protein [Slackia equolifaciens]RNL38249.1 DUF4160 domain-containing protein [Slackia equolifaciens]HJF66064.1 DUF4160 domain-containing protein [Slackia equolifaciens]